MKRAVEIIWVPRPASKPEVTCYECDRLTDHASERSAARESAIDRLTLSCEIDATPCAGGWTYAVYYDGEQVDAGDSDRPLASRAIAIDHGQVAAAEWARARIDRQLLCWEDEP